MGVTGLWTVLQPCARPIKLETLNKKRLAVDASIWIYQFLKAVRDKEGNALRNSHVVGFFRRICKLLFFGIKPVFVFDGGAPALKRQTITARKRRREGRRDDAVRTAGKLLAAQMQRRAEEEQERRRRQRDQNMRQEEEEEEEIPDDLVYVDELQMTQQERQQTRTFKKTDQYHLPNLDVSIENMGAPDDLRIMSQEELEEYARQFHSGEDINLYDFSKIDFNGPFFLSLPASDRYNILNAARLRSRLRMGYSKDQLDTMFPDRMAFSKFQVERVTERNDLTQRLMNINGMNGEDGLMSGNSGGRIAGEKGKEYMLVKNDGIEGGWALGVVSSRDGGERDKPIDVEGITQPPMAEDDEEAWEDDNDGFEDVPIEGLNRLPKMKAGRNGFGGGGGGLHEADEQRRALYHSRKRNAERLSTANNVPETNEPNSLFVQADHDRSSQNRESQDTEALFTEQHLPSENDEDDDLSRAIAMSLEDSTPFQGDDYLSTVNPPVNDTVVEAGYLDIRSEETDANVTSHRRDAVMSNSDSDDDMDLQAALAESRLSKYHAQEAGDVSHRESKALSGLTSAKLTRDEGRSNPSSYAGPLPFERLEMSQLGRGSKTSGPPTADAGGFERDEDQQKAKEALPLPPWFSSDVQDDLRAQKALGGHEPVDAALYGGLGDEREKILRAESIREIIDVDSLDDPTPELVPAVDLTDADETIHANGQRSMDLQNAPKPPRQPERTAVPKTVQSGSSSHREPDEEMYDWEASDGEGGVELPNKNGSAIAGAGTSNPGTEPPPSSSPTFEEVPKYRDPISITDTLEGLVEMEETAAHDSEQDPADENDDRSDPEDDELMRQLAVEAEEHARFASSLNHKSQLQNQEDYERELRSLRSQQKKDRRDADEVSHVMIAECQQLLKHFGLPYITAPMEAEAQCAELVRLGLVDGIVTDDSDCFLFGGTRVYKNMFNQAKFVECYLASDLEKEFDLNREKLIQFAHLLGSDYTEGIPGVGPVTALEILSEFNSENGLEDFKLWWQGVQTGKSSADDVKSPFKKKFRRNLVRIFLPPTFPSVPVTQAYLHPDVDSSRTPFQWGVPDLDSLRSFLMATIGWSQERTDEVLVPVIRDINRRENEGTQSNLTAFFGGGTGAGPFAPRRRDETTGAKISKTASRRLEGALGKMKEGAKRKRRSVAPRGRATEGRRAARPSGAATPSSRSSASRSASESSTRASSDDVQSKTGPRPHSQGTGDRARRRLR